MKEPHVETLASTTTQVRRPDGRFGLVCVMTLSNSRSLNRPNPCKLQGTTSDYISGCIPDNIRPV
jgi:hypothetical protein